MLSPTVLLHWRITLKTGKRSFDPFILPYLSKKAEKFPICTHLQTPIFFQNFLFIRWCIWSSQAPAKAKVFKLLKYF